MRRTPSKKAPIAKPRSKSNARKGGIPALTEVQKKMGTQPAEYCHHCSKSLVGAERALFVEEEVGRIFCSEDCITGYFAPEIKRLEKEYLKKLSPRDLPGDEREKLAHLRWATLQKPDEVWCEKTLSGDHRYTLISKFSPKGQKPVWCVCICLFLRGDPSFLYLAFPTQNAAMVHHFRKGEQVEVPAKKSVEKNGKKSKKRGQGGGKSIAHHALEPSESMDRLAGSWTEDDLLQAELRQARRKDDIPREQFEKYLKYFEETLESPDEVWSTVLQVGSAEAGGVRPLKARRTPSSAEVSATGGPSEGSIAESTYDSSYEKSEGSDEESVSDALPEDKRLYHFLRAYSDQKPVLWYIIVARDTDEEEEIEILDSFPTHDESLVHRYRTGRQDVGEGPAEEPLRRVLH